MKAAIIRVLSIGILFVGIVWSTHAEASPLTISFPNGGEVLQPGNIVTISWSGVPLTDPVSIDYSTNTGSTWIPITTSATGGHYQWLVPNTPSNSCLARVIHAGMVTNCGSLIDTVMTIYADADSSDLRSNTGILVGEGQTVTFQNSGRWNWQLTNEDCSPDTGTPGRPFPSELPVLMMIPPPPQFFGVLVARVGNDPYFVAKSGTSYVSTSCGFMKLLMSDRLGYYYDNRGSILSHVTVSGQSKNDTAISASTWSIKCSFTVLTLPEPITHGHLHQTVSYSLGIDFDNSTNIGALIQNSSTAQFQLQFDPSVLQLSSVVAPSGWLLQSISTNSGLLNVSFSKASSSTLSMDSLGEVIFNVISVASKHTTLDLLSFGFTDSSGLTPFCVGATEGAEWVILLDSASASVASLKTGFEVSQIYPNPAMPSSEVQLHVSGTSSVSLRVFDILGRESQDLAQRLDWTKGEQVLTIPTIELPSGTYFLRLESQGVVVTREFYILQ
jgi:hypothetical protein